MRCKPHAEKSFVKIRAAAETRLMQAATRQARKPGASNGWFCCRRACYCAVNPGQSIARRFIAERAIRGAGVGAALGGLYGFGTGNMLTSA